ncbi:MULTISPECIES: LacI family DNA-binding transcriptional regulator [Cellulomonas]|uniref:LacI family DNA-binding transcriptional regulator n=1 Tax=Cellulomonas TaxID=1707 RepID=UPI0010A84BF0|nr:MULTISPECIES: LacI family DNA-binding transcriptional regulator [Cellulomonas]
MPTTLHDVAREAGVSAATASRALTGGTVSAGTRASVRAAAERLGYRPNRAARGLITGRAGALGLVVPDLTNPFFADVAKGVAARARAADLPVFVADADEEAGLEVEAVRSLARSTDGLLLCSPRAADAQLLDVADARATVLLHRRVPGLASVVADLADGTRQAVEHLRALGHRRIAYVPGSPGSWAGEQRDVGLAAATADGGVEVVRFPPVAPTVAGGVQAADLVLADGATAVLAYNDLVAVGLLGRATARGVRVPEDLSVVGHDDTVATMAHPSLTTVAVPQRRAGAAAVDLLLRLVAAARTPGAPLPEDAEVTLTTHLVVRASTAEPTRPR